MGARHAVFVLQSFALQQNGVQISHMARTCLYAGAKLYLTIVTCTMQCDVFSGDFLYKGTGCD